MPEPFRVLVVEDHALTRAGLVTSLAADPSFVVAGEAADGPSGYDRAKALAPDVAVIDIGLPGEDGIALTRRIRRDMPNTHVVILTMHDLEDEVIAALAAGADAYCLKTSRTERVLEAVRIAAEGGVYFDPQVAHVVLRELGRPATPVKAVSSPLTPRETQVLELISEGRSNAEIAEQLSIGLGTVKGHIRDILDKLAVADRTQAAVEAFRRGLI
ncbi:MAG TPA: response regulator transcription factor [Candidatus Eremiobacteraceae bacterium]|nr:response regulator transcription factor [Candidatus Eremiobacteraceae bacterium]